MCSYPYFYFLLLLWYYYSHQSKKYEVRKIYIIQCRAVCEVHSASSSNPRHTSVGARLRSCQHHCRNVTTLLQSTWQLCDNITSDRVTMLGTGGIHGYSYGCGQWQLLAVNPDSSRLPGCPISHPVVMWAHCTLSVIMLLVTVTLVW